MSSAVPRAPRPGLFRVIDWRLVAAIGLPVWAFLIGAVVMHKSAPRIPGPPIPAPTTPIETAAVPPAAPAAAETAPAPREVVIRTEYRPVPVPVPVLTSGEPGAGAAAEPAAAVEFKLPPSEVLPADRCKTFDTKIRFHPDLTAAASEAKTSKRMLLVLHISGNFDDPGFT